MKTVSITSALALVLAGTSAFAVQPLNQLSASKRAQLNSAFEAALKASNEQVNALLNVTDSKGESLFNKTNIVTENEPGLWSQKDPVKDKIEGTSTEKAYQSIRIPRKGNEIIVAVIDSGVDITHQDLKGKTWVNQAEFYGKPGIDDDKDGYIDDVFGWNFLGNAKGQNISGNTLEVTREYVRLKKKQESVGLTEEEKTYFAQVSADFEEGKKSTEANLAGYQAIKDAYALLKAAGLKEETIEAVNAIAASDETTTKAKALVLKYLARGVTSARAASVVDDLTEAKEFNYNTEFNSSDIVGDNPADFNEIGYGNNDVTGPDASHGTHVAGIIAAIRNNKLGIDGQALNVKIMSVRAVPNGDERDKDVANAIRFAVDHGAKVINMSFGKAYSQNKAVVDAAILYAETKGVLLVHAAGNDGKNTNAQNNNYPNRKMTGQPDVLREAQNWLEIGASDKNNDAQQLPANFSNFGKTAVDVFAPGVGIVSSIPGNQYAKFNGTSMASPEVAGVAALLLNKFPQATVAEIKDAILSTTNQYGDLVTKEPGSGTPVKFANLSVTGGTVNAYKAMLKLMNNLGYLSL
jgi:cell wall-associated protease